MGGDSRRKKEKRPPIKRTDQLPPIPLTTDRTVATEQRSFCKSIIVKILEDEASLSFSKPVDQLWDISILEDYFEQIKKPMDLGTVRKRLSSDYNQPDTALFDPNPFREDTRLVFLNALDYNPRGSDLAKLAARFLSFVDSEVAKLPMPHGQQFKAVLAEKTAAKPQDVSDSKATPNQNTSDDKLEAQAASSDGKKEPTDDDDHDKDKTKANDDNENDPAEENGSPMDDEAAAKDDAAADEERDKLEQHLKDLTKTCNRSNDTIAGIELEKNAPLSHEENTRLRDEVERLPWETSQKVVEILRKYVDDALKTTEESDPEFVTLELSTVETRLLRQIEELIRPDPRIIKEKETLEIAQKEMDTVKRKLKRLHEASANSKRKRAKKSR